LVKFDLWYKLTTPQNWPRKLSSLNSCQIIGINPSNLIEG
jgi:hypothetical protein